ncbi:class II glutamine amidotransferase [Thioalkalivibrio paradoxus]|uniref:Glutamine amidotransferase n=1 Tax=Thioalkalivibrio paradoxus ARh 1 TaxID=713585 RepID=W0DF06_9GAMM|nr:class II glutamine amidotransferase [Thioalkalivibrio paradoxus]AHE97199.1 glutamine amidotransferase [Thioalkalivibrio paradoxus ARh 1]
MCELLAMSSLEPATLSISLEAFSERGGLRAPHKDGWGAAFYSGRDVRRLRDTGAASQSSGIRFLSEQKYRSRLVLAHVRQATKGAVSLENTQPFARELGGRMHVFAHNGDLIGIEDATAPDLGRFRPIGDTDSEHAFCLLLARLAALWDAPEPPALELRLEVVRRFAALLRPFGPANFLYSDSEYLFVHGHERTQESCGRIEPPGLFTLCRTCPTKKEGRTPKPIEGLTLGLTEAHQRVTLVASVPLTAERWEPVAAGEVLAIAGGRILSRTGAALPDPSTPQLVES